MISEELADILECLERTSGTNDKIQIIKENKDCAEFLNYMEFALNPYKRFNIAKIPILDMKKPITMVKCNDIFMLLDWLLKKKGVTNADLNNVAAHLHHPKENNLYKYKWLTKIITKSSIAGVGASIVNKALGKPFIPKFKCMLMDNVKVEDVKFPIIAQVKCDGFRCLGIPKVGYFGRSGKPIANKNLEKYLNLISDYVTDGELYSHKRNFNSIASILRKEDAEIPEDIKYVIYDALLKEQWEKQECDYIYESRFEIAYVVVNGECNKDNKSIDLIESRAIMNIEELKDYYNDVLERGYEGLVVKNPDSPYQWKRVTAKSGIMGKIKPVDQIDATIIGRFEGEGEIVGKLGGFIVKLESGKEVRVGSGFTKEERINFWKDDFKLYDKQWIRLKYTELTPDGSLRFPRFDSFRDSK